MSARSGSWVGTKAKRFRRRHLSPWIRRNADRVLPKSVTAGTPRWHWLRSMAGWWRAQAHTPTRESREDLYASLAARWPQGPATYLEFGVASGTSLRWWIEKVDRPDTRFYGFDTFEGLPERWGRDPAGSYGEGGRAPAIEDDRVDLVVGLFTDTLAHFDATLGHPLVAHLDADLYDSTASALGYLGDHLETGDVLIFDELLDVERPHHEFAAFIDAAEAFEWSYHVIEAVRWGPQVAIEIVSAGRG